MSYSYVGKIFKVEAFYMLVQTLAQLLSSEKYKISHLHSNLLFILLSHHIYPVRKINKSQFLIAIITLEST